MPRKPDSEGKYVAPDTKHYNVKFVSGMLCSRVTHRYFEDWKSSDIEWVWLVEERRELTRKEISKLCARS